MIPKKIATAIAIAPKTAPITEPISDAVLRPEEPSPFTAPDVFADGAVVVVFADEALAVVFVGEVGDVLGALVPEIAAEGDAVARLD